MKHKRFTILAVRALNEVTAGPAHVNCTQGICMDRMRNNNNSIRQHQQQHLQTLRQHLPTASAFSAARLTANALTAIENKTTAPTVFNTEQQLRLLMFF